METISIFLTGLFPMFSIIWLIGLIGVVRFFRNAFKNATEIDDPNMELSHFKDFIE